MAGCFPTPTPTPCTTSATTDGGARDLLTTPDVTQQYFNSIRAPEKALVTVPDAGHDPNPPMVDAQFRLLKERILPLAR